MTLADTLHPVFVFILIVNAVSCAFPLLSHRLVFYPIVFVALGLLYVTLLVLLMGATVMMRNQSFSDHRVKENTLIIIKRDVNMTTWMVISTVVMVAWMYCWARRVWLVYILPMVEEYNAFKSRRWADALDLRGRMKPTVS
ncbi:hypothetical protein, conserved [Trypanosoma brucei gambiense DAL972]|uniref:Uncharacterized protein n=2 Tax=Trypanosoma brucei TaxID=5691 RepID=Q584E5_TRYB2|nr:hypothetical protein, conserved [Trypanosoma brucei gambiense DAL972]XP_844392.1 hypothetical protein, conserved [Trypanosoma brucei brucei TREU927]AAX79060.1 hypothetical protein, conserved [Trypanosoma brucei]AAZ10833.1 hypothetical protein, conserved [Trypanosoma brucei brucei TREU927]CBH10536.1 hypothetical protein, conserved [Trypanosoma brucei gambiense DAL972]|eukprot:XP_011772825.1 hypothetical protein, conserved [Trypanosoma brucei gambiense DAL972]